MVSRALKVSEKSGHQEIKLVPVPTYDFGQLVHRVEINKEEKDKGRLKLGRNVIDRLMQRNAYNLLTDNRFNVSEHKGLYHLCFEDNPISYTKSNKKFTKEDIDRSTLDKVVYLAEGRLSNGRPHFGSVDADTVFLYSSTDAQILRYSAEWTHSGFADNHATVKVNNQERIQLHAISEATRAKIIDETSHVRITGHPELFCVTLTRP